MLLIVLSGSWVHKVTGRWRSFLTVPLPDFMKASLVAPDHVFAPLTAYSLVDPLLVGCPEGLVAEDLVILVSKLSQLLDTFGH